MNEKKVVFFCVEGIHGLADPLEFISIDVKLYPKGESSPGKIILSEKKEPKCHTTWSLIYHSELDEFILITLSLKNNEYAKLLLPIKWFEVNKVVTETFPMLVTDQKAAINKTKIMITVLVHRSENGECAFIADLGHLLVKPEWNSNQNNDSHEVEQKSTINIQQQLPQSQQMVFLNTPQQTYMVPISIAGQNQVLVPMQVQSQFLSQVPFTQSSYQNPIQPFIYAQGSLNQQYINQQQIPNPQVQQNLNSQEQAIPSEYKAPSNSKECENSAEHEETIQQGIQENLNEEQPNPDNHKIDQDDQEIEQSDKKIPIEPKNRQIQLNQDSPKQDKKIKKAQSSQRSPKLDENVKKEKITDDQEIDKPLTKKAQGNLETPKNDQKTKKTQVNQTNQKSDQKVKKGVQANQDVQKTDQKLKKAQSSQDTQKPKKSQSSQDTQKPKKARTSQKDPIPVLSPLTVYIKTSDGKFKPMLLIPSTKDAPAQLKHINQQTQ